MRAVLFIPSVERDGVTPIDQGHRVGAALSMFGAVFGGATAHPRARGVWRDDEHADALVFDEPVIVHGDTVPEAIEDPSIMRARLDMDKIARELGAERRGE